MKYRLFNVGIRGATLLIKFLLVLCLAVFMPPEDVGLYGLITVTVSYSIYFLGFEFYTYSTRNLVGRPNSEWPRLISTQVIFFGIMYLIMIPLMSLIFIFGLIPLKFLLGFIILIILQHLSSELTRLLIVMERPLLATIIIFVKQALWAVFLIIGMWLFPVVRSIEALLVFWIIGVGLAIIIGVRPLLSLDWRLSTLKPDWKWVKRGIWVALPLLLSTIAARALFTFDRYAFEAFNGLALLGAYSVYMSIAAAMLAFMESGVFVFFYPKMIKAYKNNDCTGFSAAYKALIKQSFLWMSFLLLIMTVVVPVIFSFLNERIYSENIALFYGILIAMVIFLIGYIYQYALYTTSRDKTIIFANISGFIVAAILVLLFGRYYPYWSVTGAMIVGCVISAVIKYGKWLSIKQSLLNRV
jgi:O-antigen/teichoic acid export membrane protein